MRVKIYLTRKREYGIIVNMNLRVRLLEDVEDATGTPYRKGMEVDAIRHPSSGAIYVIHARGLQLSSQQYEVAIADEEFDRLLAEGV